MSASSESEATPYEENHAKRVKREYSNDDEYVHIVLTNISPWLSTRIPYSVAMKTIEPLPSQDLRDIDLPTLISLNVIDDTSTRDFGDFLTVASLMRKRLISDFMMQYIFTHMRLIVRVCNQNVIAFCKQLASTPEEILRFLEFADDGDYTWLQQDKCNLLLNYFFSNRRSSWVRDMEAPLLKYIFIHSKN
jgi:hypothetical protein